VPLIVPQTIFEPRRTQLDLRVSKSFRVAANARLRANFDIYNVLNDSSVLRATGTYGPRWLTPLSTAVGSGFTEARLFQVGAQLTF
jgi:hypothetical protein